MISLSKGLSLPRRVLGGSGGGSSLAAPIQAEKDRAEAGGATIESGVYPNLIDPIYDILDGAGEWSNVDAFYPAGVRDVASGAVSKIYDQSGGQNDATQSTSSQQPTDDTDANFGGKVAANFDRSDDLLNTGLSALGTSYTLLFGVTANSDWTTWNNGTGVLSSLNGSDGVHVARFRLQANTEDKEDLYSFRGGVVVVDSTQLANPSGDHFLIESLVNDDTGIIAENDANVTQNTGSSSAGSEAATLALGNDRNGSPLDGNLVYALLIQGQISSSLQTDLYNTFDGYYS